MLNCCSICSPEPSERLAVRPTPPRGSTRLRSDEGTGSDRRAKGDDSSGCGSGRNRRSFNASSKTSKDLMNNIGIGLTSPRAKVAAAARCGSKETSAQTGTKVSPKQKPSRPSVSRQAGSAAAEGSTGGTQSYDSVQPMTADSSGAGPPIDEDSWDSKKSPEEKNQDDLMPFKRQRTRTGMNEPGEQLQKRKSLSCMENYLKLQQDTPATISAEASAVLADAEGAPRTVTADNIDVSIRVVRGKDWCWKEEDGGVGSVGIILSFDKDAMTAQVLWEKSCRAHSHYRFGSFRDLVLAPQAAEEKTMAMIGRRNSQEFFSAKTQTLLIFDWDDTLFPTTYVRDDMDLCWRKPMKDQDASPREKADITKKLDVCAVKVVDLLRSANKLGKLVLVTLARSPWVMESSKNFFPTVGELIKELDIPVVYAQEGIHVDYDKQEMSSDEEVEKFWSGVKGKAIARECRDFYSQYEGQSWKNVISIGDSDFERLGTQSATEDYMKEIGIEANCSKVVDVNGHMYKIRTKTFKMVDQPTIEELTVELDMLKTWLPLMVKLDSGFDVNLNNADDPHVLRNIEKVLRGETPTTKKLPPKGVSKQ
eukprot:TRINITY_DN74277_c0_g1_i1.p1 TRINITY_DN74277_c0_g1~~TRINITY_DN74277_c0_g1_i1.p1  ORF type:complete len:592 (-),score=129.41 TRINITY_DN74277_c0_g1_i1:118-1893(-)